MRGRRRPRTRRSAERVAHRARTDAHALPVAVRPSSRSSPAACTTAPSAAYANAPPTETRATPTDASSRDGRRAREREDVDRQLDRLDDAADVVELGQPRRVEHIGAGLLIGAQALDRVVEVGATVQVVLGARGQHEVHGAGVRRLGGRRDALGSPARGRRSARRPRRCSPRSSSRQGRRRARARSSRRRRPGRRRSSSRGRPRPAAHSPRRSAPRARSPPRA